MSSKNKGHKFCEITTGRVTISPTPSLLYSSGLFCSRAGCRSARFRLRIRAPYSNKRYSSDVYDRHGGLRQIFLS
jgi:hypothetical protein